MWGKGAELGEAGGADCSPPVPTGGRAKMTGASPAGSDRPMAHTETAAVTAFCSTSPSCAELSPGGDGVAQRGARTNVNLKRSRPDWAPGSGQEGSRECVGRTGAKSGSRPGSWSVR